MSSKALTSGEMAADGSEPCVTEMRIAFADAIKSHLGHDEAFKIAQEAREQGRREVLREIAAMDPKQTSPDGLHDWCAFCPVDPTIEPHAPSCLWLRAQAVKASD